MKDEGTQSVSKKDKVEDYIEDKNLVYGASAYTDELIIIPKSLAEDLADLWPTIWNSNTWGELQHNLPPWLYEDIVSTWNDYRDGYEEGAEEIEGMQPAALSPDAPFDGERFKQVIDYWTENTEMPWPLWVAGSLDSWVDPEIVGLYGQEASSMVNGIWVTFDLEDTDRILAALRRRGYTCRKAQRLIFDITAE